MSVNSTQKVSDLAFKINTSNFVVISDVPKEKGGESRAPEPHEYLEISLAACTAMTLQLFANRKGIPLEFADVKIQITKEGAENTIRREIKLNGDLNEDQRKVLFAIAEKCPIHNFLTRGAKIESLLMEQA